MTLLLAHGAAVDAVGIRLHGGKVMPLLEDDRLSVHLVDRTASVRRNYARWFRRTLGVARARRPDWLYASDPLSAPAALALARLLAVPVIYHEHDAPQRSGQGVLVRLAVRARDMLARRAELCVLPSEERRRSLADHLDGQIAAVTAWNCPLRTEVGPPRAAPDRSRFRIWYHGSLVPERLPHALLEALAVLPAEVTFTFGGYETQGASGFTADFLARAGRMGLEGRVFATGFLDLEELRARIGEADLGCAFVDPTASDTNLHSLAGASNKVFEYLAAGVPALVPPGDAWRALVVGPGYGVAAAAEASAIVAAVMGLMDDRQATHAMGEAGRQRILAAWNYDTQFAPVLRRMLPSADGVAAP
ncbi:MAG: glycosyltransferase [Gemmatimonadota bacterium]